MANILYLSKYPPLEGGIAAKTYWLANALAGRGHAIHVVTDALAVDTHLTIPNTDHPPETPGVFVHRADQAVPWHIPNDSHRDLSLLDKALEVIEENKPDLIVGGYLIPYGIIASQIGRLSGIPFVLLHGGSDIYKFLLNNIWPHALSLALAGACLVVTDYDNQGHIRRFTDSITVLPPYVPDPSVFAWQPRPANDKCTLALVGKANYHWLHKGWQKIVDLWNQLGGDCRFVVVSQGIGLEDFRASLPSDLVKKISWQFFVPPWEIPDLLRTIDGLFYFGGQLPFPMFSNTVLEAFACGTTVLTDSIDILDGYRRHGIALGGDMTDLLPFTLLDQKSAKYEIAKYLAKPEAHVAWNCAPAFDQYVAALERVFLDAIEINSGNRT